MLDMDRASRVQYAGRCDLARLVLLAVPYRALVYVGFLPSLSFTGQAASTYRQDKAMSSCGDAIALAAETVQRGREVRRPTRSPGEAEPRDWYVPLCVTPSASHTIIQITLFH